MSTQNKLDNLTKYFLGLIEGKDGVSLIKENNISETKFLPRDIVPVFDRIFEKINDIDEIKIASNKFFNILYKNLSEDKNYTYPKNSIITLLIKDNSGVKNHLARTREYIKHINKKPENEIKSKLIRSFEELNEFTAHYTVKENIIFSEIEKYWDNYQCLKLMWSFHNDIRKNIKKTIEILQADKFDLKLFNQTSSKVYFNINTIIFREEYVLFPAMYETIEKDILDKMLREINDFKLLYIKAENIEELPNQPIKNKQIIKLSTGEISLDQIELIFNHLPVDITYVDENNKVKFFSNPKHRIFPRTTNIIGRDVQNCHPHESVEIVNKIIESFKNGEKDTASFWLKMGPIFVLIKYFAVRDKDNNYNGVLEVSQEISEIQKLKGERRLLDW